MIRQSRKDAMTAFHAVPALPCTHTPRPFQHRGLAISSKLNAGAAVRVTRRAALHALALAAELGLLPTVSQARRLPTKPLATSLVPLVRVRDALDELAESVDNGTNGDVRRVVRLVLTGSDLPRSAREAGLWLDKARAETAETRAREAFEYLNQVVDYFDPVATRERPGSEMLAFCRKAIEAAAIELDGVLGLFDAGAVAEARTAVAAAVP